MKNAKEILGLFATPVIRFKFEKHEEYVDKWENWDKDERQPVGWQCGVNTSFPQVEKDDPYAPMEVVEQLEKDLLFHIKKVLRSYSLSSDVMFHAFWYNAYYTKQGQESHHHLPEHGVAPVWSGVYFAKNCLPNQFSFQRTEFSLRSQGALDYSNSPLRKYYEDVYTSKFTDGDIVLFPPHLHHCVKVKGKTNETEQRLTFSFNIDNVGAVEYRRKVLGHD